VNASQGLVKSYKVDVSATQYQAVVAGATGNGYCKTPAAANAPGFLGFTLEPQPNAGKGVAVQKTGIARAVANGNIAYGDRCAIASNAGDVASEEAAVAAALAAAATVINIVGRAEESAVAGQIFAIWIEPESVALAVS
jgi:hypothetical protein